MMAWINNDRKAVFFYSAYRMTGKLVPDAE